MMAELLRALLYAFTALTTWLCLERCFGRERPLIAVLGAYLVCYGALFGISLLGSAVIDFAAFALTCAALVRFCHRRDAKTTALCAAVLTAAMLFSEAAVWGVFALFVPPADGALYAAALDAISRLLYFLLTFASASIFSPRAEARGAEQNSRLFVALPSVCIVVSAASVFFGFGGDTNGTGGTMTVLFILSLLFMNILLLMQHERMRRTNAEYTALQLSIQQETSDLSYYRTLQEKYSDERILVHDIKNHFRAIEGLAAESRADEVVKYISGLEDGFLPASPVQVSVDPILNAILIRYETECEARGIDLRLELDEGGRSFLDATSTTMLFGNLLSNALEASESSTEKWIELSTRYDEEQRSCTIIIVNSCDTVPERSDRAGYVSNKRDRRLHGVGLKSISRVVQSYNGIDKMYYDEAGRSFHHIIQFPI